MTVDTGTSPEKRSTSLEVIRCPLCSRGEITVLFTAGYLSWNVVRISAKSKRVRFYHSPTYAPQNACPACGAPKPEIRAALEKGRSGRASHAERMQRLKEAGFPTTIRAPVAREK